VILPPSILSFYSSENSSGIKSELSMTFVILLIDRRKRLNSNDPWGTMHFSRMRLNKHGRSHHSNRALLLRGGINN
jgi:hypothetical protein